MASDVFSIANRALRLQRQGVAKELTEFLGDASTKRISKELFDEKREYFEKLWNEIVLSTEDCISLLDNGEDSEGEMLEKFKE